MVFKNKVYKQIKLHKHALSMSYVLFDQSPIEELPMSTAERNLCLFIYLFFHRKPSQFTISMLGTCCLPLVFFWAFKCQPGYILPQLGQSYKCNSVLGPRCSLLSFP